MVEVLDEMVKREEMGQMEVEEEGVEVEGLFMEKVALVEKDMVEEEMDSVDKMEVYLKVAEVETVERVLVKKHTHSWSYKILTI